MKLRDKKGYKKLKNVEIYNDYSKEYSFNTIYDDDCNNSQIVYLIILLVLILIFFFLTIYLILSNENNNEIKTQNSFKGKKNI